jgi:hypothetical protein
VRVRKEREKMWKVEESGNGGLVRNHTISSSSKMSRFDKERVFRGLSKQDRQFFADDNDQDENDDSLPELLSHQSNNSNLTRQTSLPSKYAYLNKHKNRNHTRRDPDPDGGWEEGLKNVRNGMNATKSLGRSNSGALRYKVDTNRTEEVSLSFSRWLGQSLSVSALYQHP